MAKLKNDGTWFVKFPTFKYNEDVKGLARKNGLKIIDIKFMGDMEQHPKAPKLTINEDFTPAKSELAEAKEEVERLKAELAAKKG